MLRWALLAPGACSGNAQNPDLAFPQPGAKGSSAPDPSHTGRDLGGDSLVQDTQLGLRKVQAGPVWPCPHGLGLRPCDACSHQLP